MILNYDLVVLAAPSRGLVSSRSLNIPEAVLLRLLDLHVVGVVWHRDADGHGHVALALDVDLAVASVSAAAAAAARGL